MAKKISIITPCFNAESYIEETIESVMNQSAILAGRAELEYIICDGKSTDRTVSLIERKINGYNQGTIKVLSEKDSGMYDALSRGLKVASGDICAYINAGDFYSKQAFDIVLEIFEKRDVRWLTGMNVLYNDRSQMVHVMMPFKYRKRFFERGLYGSILPFVQQESTFWDSSLNRVIDHVKLMSMKYAGDFYLWQTFSRFEELKIVQAYLGGFRKHSRQLSSNARAYYAEMNSVAEAPGTVDFMLGLLDRFVWQMPVQIKKYLNRENLFIYDHGSGRWI